MTKPMQEIRRDFVIAAWNGEIDKIRATLDVHPEAVKWVDPRSGVTALHHAAAQSRTDVIEFLLKMGADPNARDGEGMTPLMHAARNGGETHVQALLEGGADAAYKDENGYDALFCTSDRIPQPRNADIIRAWMRATEEKRQAEEEARRRADIENAANEMHAGTTQPVPVNKPLRLKF